MGSLSIWHWIIVIAVVLLLFGRGKISELMGDVAQGIKAFKKGMSEDEVAKAEPAARADEDDRHISAARRRRPRSRRPRRASKARPPERSHGCPNMRGAAMRPRPLSSALPEAGAGLELEGLACSISAGASSSSSAWSRSS